MPTIKITQDFTHGMSGGGAPFDSIAGSPQSDTSILHANDPASLLLDATAAAEWVFYNDIDSPTIGWQGFWWRLNTIHEPAGDRTVAFIDPAAGGAGRVAFAPASLSEATIEKALAQFATAVAPSLDRIYEGLTRSQTVHFDETGFRIANQLAYLHTACTDWLSYYIVHCKRGDEAMLDMGVLPKSHGWAVHDGLKAYFGFETVRHALCNAHHLRELEFAFEQYEATWAKSMQSLLLEMKEQVEKQSLSTTVLSQLERRYEQLLKAGFEAFPIQDRPPKHQGQFAQHPVTNLLIRLRDYRAAVLAFLYHPEVPFDNNLAERDLRMMKVQLKISGCFRFPLKFSGIRPKRP